MLSYAVKRNAQKLSMAALAFLAFAQFSQPAVINPPASQAFHHKANVLNIGEYRTHYELRKELNWIYRTIAEKDIYYGNTLLLTQGTYINYAKYRKLLSFYCMRNNLFEDSDGRIYAKREGFNCYSPNQKNVQDYFRSRCSKRA